MADDEAGGVGYRALEDVRSEAGADHDVEKNQLGTLNGVYVPCVLNILGVVLFLQLGWGIGQMGVLGVALIFAVAETQVTMTVLSVAAMTSNGGMKGGGSYYMISRTLGPELGGAIGILFYSAFAVGSCYYAVGFAEELIVTWWPHLEGTIDGYWVQVAMTSATLFLILVISLLGAESFAKVNTYLFMGQFFAILFALLSMWFSGHKLINVMDVDGDKVEQYWFGMKWSVFSENLSWKLVDGATVKKVFAVLFPGVTGIMEGANLSGDLKDPARSIGKGTLWAVASAIATYTLLVLTEASGFDRATLVSNKAVLQHVSWTEYIVVAGILVSTASSCLGAIFGGSRVIQAVARDNLIPILRPLAYGSPKGDEPRNAVIFTWFVAQCCAFIGDLKAVSPVLTCFFCLSYALTNLACFVLAVSGTPNWRPRFRSFSWHTALLGVIMNAGVMFWMSPVYGAVAVLAFLLIFFYLVYRAPEAESWGAASQSIIFHQVRKYLLRLDERQHHSKNWRPSVLLLPASGSLHRPTLDFCNNLKKGGLYVVGQLLPHEEQLSRIESARTAWQSLVARSNLKAFVNFVRAPSARDGATNLMLTAGLGAMNCNTVVMDLVDFHDGSVSSESSPVQLQSLVQVDEDAVARTARFASAQEYLLTWQDCLSLEKNLVVLANMSRLDSSLIVQRTLDHAMPLFCETHDETQWTDKWLDIWVRADEFSWQWSDPRHGVPTLLLQLAYIMSRNKQWARRLKLRVMLVLGQGETSSEAVDRRQAQLMEVLQETRVDVARIVLLRHPSECRNESATIDNLEVITHDDVIVDTPIEDLVQQYQVPLGSAAQAGGEVKIEARETWTLDEAEYESANAQMRRHSADTLFAMLSVPNVATRAADSSDASTALLRCLQILTQALPPTAFVLTGENIPVVSTSI